MARISISDLYRGEGPGEKYGGILNAVMQEFLTNNVPEGCDERTRIELRNAGAPERCRCKNRLRHAGAQQRRLHPGYLHPHYHRSPAPGSGHHGKSSQHRHPGADRSRARNSNRGGRRMTKATEQQKNE